MEKVSPTIIIDFPPHENVPFFQRAEVAKLLLASPEESTIKGKGKEKFLAPTGAQEVTMCVRPSVRPFVRSKLVWSSHSSSFWLKTSNNQLGISQQSVSTQRALREQSVSIKIRVNTDGA